MKPSDVAKRLGLPAAAVLDVVVLDTDKHGDTSWVATLDRGDDADGERVLVTETTCRRWVPEVDGYPDGEDPTDQGDDPEDDDPGTTPAKSTPRKRTPRKTTARRAR